MYDLVAKPGGGLAKTVKADWMPDPGVFRYVMNLLDDLGVVTDVLPEHWVPIAIQGAMDWIKVCGWWIPEYTGIFKSSEPYHWVFVWDGRPQNEVYEFDPDKLLMFREHPEENMFQERFDYPGLADEERTEAVQFLMQDVYPAWDKEAPPQDFVEIALYAAFMWVLSDYGRDWLYTVDPLISSVHDFGVAYYSLWDPPGLLDPNRMSCQQREVGTCRICGHAMWCVAGALLDEIWAYVCNNCLKEEADKGNVVDALDNRTRHPACPQFGGTCLSTQCPHHPDTEDSIKRRFREVGSRRVADYRERMRMNNGMQDRQLEGQTLDDLLAHFRGLRPSDDEPFLPDTE